MRWQIGWQGIAFAILLFGGGLFLGSYRYSGEPTHSSASERLQPAPAGPPTSTDGTIVYVPVYSSLYLGVSTRAADGRLGSHGQRAQHQLPASNHRPVGAVLRFVGKTRKGLSG